MALTAAEAGKIYAAIHANPIAKAAAANGNDQLACDTINAPTITVYRRIGVKDVLRWAAMGRMQKISTAANSGGTSVRSQAQAALQMLQACVGDIDVDAEFLALLDSLVTGSVLSAADKTAFLDRCAEQISVAEREIGRAATIEDVGIAMAVDRPDGKIPKAQVI